MSDRQTMKQRKGISDRIIEGAGTVKGQEDMPAPVRWVAELVQYLVAILLIAIGKAIEAIIKGGSEKSRRRHGAAKKKL
ncbi:hypothetical protein LTS18_008815 [Coniosporium uncinatum]|uniref:Uncharacterized protein n=1 Tax=Coniosporium uncinatum TaxID=93489 RepID=A0ACC3DXE8_9PEZI|nr:hypothetical protein LTS18_008815 [Coniosporium uncinatum]